MILYLFFNRIECTKLINNDLTPLV